MQQNAFLCRIAVALTSPRGFAYGWVFLVPTLALSAVMYHLVEKPCLNWIARRRGTPRPPAS